MRVALIQNSPLFGMPDENVDALCRLMDSVDADIFVLPELCTTGYQFHSRAEAAQLSETTDGEHVVRLRDEASRRNAAVIFGFVESAGTVVYNSSLAALPDGSSVLYRKTHLFHRETIIFGKGDTGFRVFGFRGAQIGMAICFDWLFPESFRTLALAGAQLVAHCSNLVMPYCQKADYTRAIENRIFIATANRVGSENRLTEEGMPALRFTGESVLVSPSGEYILRLDPDSPGAAVAEIDTGKALNKVINPWNDIFLDRRPGQYSLC